MESGNTYPEPKGPSYAIPAAIVIAGLFIAGALVYTNIGNDTPSNPASPAAAAETITIRPVGSTDHILGNPGADIVIVEYSDLECPFCKDFHGTLQQVIDTFGREGDVAWVYRHFPIPQLHAKAEREAHATECAWELGGNDGFWRYTDRIFEITPSNDGLADAQLPQIAQDIGLDRAQFVSCLESGKYEEKIADDFKDAQQAGGRGTPFTVIVSKDDVNQGTRDLIASASTQLPPRTIVISKDEKKIALNGALPYDFLELLLNTMLGK